MNKVYRHFSKTVADYDTVADKVVMRNDELHEIIAGSLPFDRDQPLDVLDLGCGTGHGMELISRRG